MSDPYFQQMFADRIGGVNYGKGTEIYKFEKIKRAKRKAIAENPYVPETNFGTCCFFFLQIPLGNAYD